MTSEPYEYRDGDSTFVGYLARPAAGGNGAGILVLHEGRITARYDASEATQERIMAAATEARVTQASRPAFGPERGGLRN